MRRSGVAMVLNSDGVQPRLLRRSRPLCPYPQYARYNGSGDINVASNFSCR